MIHFVSSTCCIGLLAASMICFSAAAIVDERDDFAVAAVPETISLGAIEPRTRRELTGTLHNQGRFLIHIRRAWSSCGCTSVRAVAQTLEPGEECEFSAVLNPGDNTTDSITRFLYYEVANADQSQVRFITIPITYSIKPQTPSPRPQERTLR